MGDSLEDIAYVARSSNRVSVLQSLEEGPRTRRELADETDASRATLARVLGEFEERGWIERSGEHYLATSLGRLVAREFAPLIETMRSVRTLGDVAHLLPSDDGLDLRRFADATVTTPDSGDPTAHMDRGFEHIATADRFHILANTAIPRFVREAADRLEREEFSFTATVPRTYVRDLPADSIVSTGFRDIVDNGGSVRLVDGDVDHNLALADETVVMWLCDDEGTNQGLLVTDDAVIREWAGELVAEWDDGAVPMDEATASTQHR